MLNRFAPVLAISLLGMGLWACPGTLEDPSLFADAGPGKGDAAAACNANVDIFQKKCLSCHSTASKQGGLDLEATGLFDRLKAQKATGTGCASALIVDATTPENSLLLKKVSGTQPATCGNRMPLTGEALSASEIACVSAWIKAGGK